MSRAASLRLGRVDVALVACGSTNDEAARLAALGAPHGTVVSAASQRAGRGRLGRAWSSPPGNVHLSVLLRPALAPASVPPITLAAGVAVAEAIAGLGLAPEIKWPNDVLVGGRKLAGVLTETASQAGRVEHVIVGVGVDLVGPLPAELAAIATTAADALGRPVALDGFRAALLASLERWLGAYLEGGVAAVAPTWLGHARLAGRRLAARGGDGASIEGVARGLDDGGRLELVDDGGRLHRVVAGEVGFVEPSYAASGRAVPSPSPSPSPSTSTSRSTSSSAATAEAP